MSPEDSESLSIPEDGDAAARDDRERRFQARLPSTGDQAVAAQFAESLGRAMGLSRGSVPVDVEDILRTSREQITGRKPPPLEESRAALLGDQEG
jgi:hypothetical protein